MTPRALQPWEEHCGCPTCRVGPGERCVTMSSRYTPNTTLPGGERVHMFRDGSYLPGGTTTAHKARIELWKHLWEVK